MIFLWKILFVANIKSPDVTDWATEIIKKGEKSVPAVSEAASDFIRHKMMNDGKSNVSEKIMIAFESPGLKKGVILGKSSSAYEKSRVSAPRYASLLRDCI